MRSGSTIPLREAQGRGCATTPSGVTSHTRGRTLDELEEIAIRSALARHGGNRRAISEELGIARSSLLRKLDSLRLRG